jgi:hypothetical protein
MTFSRFQAWLKPCLGSLEQGTGQQCLWTLWRARIQRLNRTPLFTNRTPVGYASDTRSGTLIAIVVAEVSRPVPSEIG